MKKLLSRPDLLKAVALLVGLIPLAIFLAGCKNDTTPSLFDPNAPKGADPIISSILPADSTLAGVGELTIKGQNFSSKPAENIVLFGADPAVVLAASTTELKVKTPNLVADAIPIRIAVQGASEFTPFVFYKLKPAVVLYADLKDAGKDAVKAFGIDVDRQGNLYVSTESNTIKKVSPDGKVTVITSKATFLRATALKVGPGNLLYAANAVARLRRISTIALDGTESVLVSLPGNPQDFDFDASGNIWVTVDTDVYLVTPSKTATKIDSYPVTLAALRVFNGYVYVAGKNATTGEEKIWRSPIQGGALGAKEVVLDVAAAGWLAGGDIQALTFSADGGMYLGTNHPDGMFVLRPDGSHEVLYPGLIAPSVYAIAWNEGSLLFAVQQLSATSNLLKIDTGKKGAPYYGRP